MFHGCYLRKNSQFCLSIYLVRMLITKDQVLAWKLMHIKQFVILERTIQNFIQPCIMLNQYSAFVCLICRARLFFFMLNVICTYEAACTTGRKRLFVQTAGHLTTCSTTQSNQHIDWTTFV